MNILYIDSRMGISGVKLLSALVDMMDQPDMFIKQFNELGLEGIRADRSSASDGAVSGTRIEFTRVRGDDYYEDEEDDDGDAGGFFSFGRSKSGKNSSNRNRHSTSDRTLEEITEIINELSVSGKIRKKAVNIYETIAKAASQSHNKPVNEVKLHRAGTRDIIASVVGVCMAMDDMEYDKVICSPVNVGAGYVSASHGTIAVPTPTLKLILGETPYAGGREEGELCTLEGAAIIKEYADEFVDMPELAVLRTGVGIGVRKFESGVNCVKLSLGTEVQTAANTTVTELEAVLFDDSAAGLKLAGERIAAAGAEEIFTMPVSRLSGGYGTLLKCICRNDDADAVAKEIIRNTSASYVRRASVTAYRADIKTEQVEAAAGLLEIERITGFGISKSRPAEREVERTARENNISIRDAYNRIIKEI